MPNASPEGRPRGVYLSSLSYTASIMEGVDYPRGDDPKTLAQSLKEDIMRLLLVFDFVQIPSAQFLFTATELDREVVTNLFGLKEISWLVSRGYICTTERHGAREEKLSGQYDHLFRSGWLEAHGLDRPDVGLVRQIAAMPGGFTFQRGAQARAALESMRRSLRLAPRRFDGRHKEILGVIERQVGETGAFNSEALFPALHASGLPETAIRSVAAVLHHNYFQTFEVEDARLYSFKETIQPADYRRVPDDPAPVGFLYSPDFLQQLFTHWLDPVVWQTYLLMHPQVIEFVRGNMRNSIMGPEVWRSFSDFFHDQYVGGLTKRIRLDFRTSGNPGNSVPSHLLATSTWVGNYAADLAKLGDAVATLPGVPRTRPVLDILTASKSFIRRSQTLGAAPLSKFLAGFGETVRAVCDRIPM